jgi:hypothetical protein
MPMIASQPQRHKLKIRLHPQQARFCFGELNDSETQHGPRSGCSDWFGGGPASSLMVHSSGFPW